MRFMNIDISKLKKNISLKHEMFCDFFAIFLQTLRKNCKKVFYKFFSKKISSSSGEISFLIIIPSESKRNIF
jgi:hypothetical protein